MKILHLVTALNTGGAELHLLALTRELRRQGDDILVVPIHAPTSESRSLRADFEAAGVRVAPLGCSGALDPRAPLRLASLVRKEKPDVVHTHLPAADFVGALGSRGRHAPARVASVHDIYSRSWRGRRLLRAWSPVWRSAGRVIAISHNVAGWLQEEHAVAAAQVSTIHYGLDVARFAARDPSRARGTIIGSIGRLEPRKGHDRLIAAMPLVRARVPNARLLIAGHDEMGYRAALEARIGQLGLVGAVELVGFQSDVGAFLRSIDVFAFASRSEGFGLVVAEAMAATLPVVVTDMPVFAEFVDKETGILVDPDDPQKLADALVRVLEDEKTAEALGVRARARIEKEFTVERMATATRAVYRDVTRGRR